MMHPSRVHGLSCAPTDSPRPMVGPTGRWVGCAGDGELARRSLGRLQPRDGPSERQVTAKGMPPELLKGVPSYDGEQGGSRRRGKTAMLMFQDLTPPLAKGLAGLLAMSDFRGVNPEESEAELGLVCGDGDDGITIAHALHGSRQAAGGGGVGGGRKEQEDCCNHGEADSPSVHAQPA